MTELPRAHSDCVQRRTHSAVGIFPNLFFVRTGFLFVPNVHVYGRSTHTYYTSLGTYVCLYIVLKTVAIIIQCLSCGVRSDSASVHACVRIVCRMCVVWLRKSSPHKNGVRCASILSASHKHTRKMRAVSCTYAHVSKEDNNNAEERKKHISVKGFCVVDVVPVWAGSL